MAVFANANYIDNVGYSGHFVGRYELYLIKIDSSGNVQWNQTFVQSKDPNSDFYYLTPSDGPYSLIQTGDEGYAIAGSTGNQVFWLLRLNSRGELLWSRTYVPTSEADSAASFDHLYSMSQTKDEGFALVGSTEAFTAVTGGGRDFWLIKVDASGNEQWNQTYNSGTYPNPSGGAYPREDEAKSVIQTLDGGYVLAGETTTYTSLSSTYELFLVKTDSSGKEQWTKKYAGPNNPGLDYQVIQTSDGGFALACSQLISTENTDFRLIKTDSSGETQWSKTYGDKYYDAPCSMIQLVDGGYAIAGTTTESGQYGPVSRDFGLLRVDSLGNTLWTKTYNAKINATLGGIKSEDNAYSMAFTQDGSYAIVGTTTNYWEGSHQDVFFVKTESLEQPPQPTPSITQTPQPLSITNVSGSVNVLQPQQTEDAWTQANNNVSLSQGSKIKTEENTGTLKLAGTSNLQMQPNTLVEVETLSGNMVTLLLHEGEFTANVKGLPSGGSLKVDMSQAVAEITGTVFTATETGTESTLSVKEGSVTFTSKVDGRTVTVDAGQKITATAAGLASTLPEQGAPGSNTAIIAVAALAILISAGLAIFGIIRRRSRKSQE